MRHYRCKCGSSRSYGSMGPPLCSKCGTCGSDLAGGPEAHREPKDHDFSLVDEVATDEGPKPLTRCRYCVRTKAEIEARQ